jgi:hypothetical protein
VYTQENSSEFQINRSKKKYLRKLMLRKRKNKKYVVYIDDNFHYQDGTARIRHKEFETCKEAVKECKKIVNEYFDRIEEKHSFEVLWGGYMTYGEDPYIVSDDDECKFSAWDYAKQRCRELSS